MLAGDRRGRWCWACGPDGSDAGCGCTGGSDHLRGGAAGAFAKFP